MHRFYTITKIIKKYGEDIFSLDKISVEKKFIHHGKVTVYEHSLNVTYYCIMIALLLPFRVDFRSLVRGALLHDYFLYDWHEADESHRLHGFTHAGRALENAERDYELNDIERDMIKKHMFPLNPAPPKYIETVILCIADKICAFKETVYCR